MIEEIKKDKDEVLSQIRLISKTENEYKDLFYKARKQSTKLEYAKTFEYHSGLRKGLEIAFNILDKYKDKEDKQDNNTESERVQYILKYWSHLQLARDYEKLEKFKNAWEELKNTIIEITKDLREECEEHHYENADLADENLSGQLLIANTLNTKWQELKQKNGIKESE